MREILGKMWLLENKTQWLEKQVKEAEDKMKQLEASVAATNDVACPNSRTEDASTGKKRNCQGRPRRTSWEDEEVHAASMHQRPRHDPPPHHLLLPVRGDTSGGHAREA
jgi:peptidoglycan hydrolase CwlO-like protein